MRGGKILVVDRRRSYLDLDSLVSQAETQRTSSINLINLASEENLQQQEGETSNSGNDTETGNTGNDTRNTGNDIEAQQGESNPDGAQNAESTDQSEARSDPQH